MERKRWSINKQFQPEKMSYFYMYLASKKVLGVRNSKLLVGIDMHLFSKKAEL